MGLVRLPSSEPRRERGSLCKHLRARAFVGSGAAAAESLAALAKSSLYAAPTLLTARRGLQRDPRSRRGSELGSLTRPPHVNPKGIRAMNYADIKYCDIANGVGVRTSLFVSGCRNHCEGCFNPTTWGFETGKPFTTEAEDAIIASLEPTHVAGLTVLGGEPLEPENQGAVVNLLKRVREAYPHKSIWLYTGFTWEEITEGPSRAHLLSAGHILDLIDVLVDGPFVLAQKDITLRFRGSSNQRIIDVPKTLAAGSIVCWEDEPVFANHTW